MHKRDFKKLVKCTSIDYLCIATCKDCDDASFKMGLKNIKAITGKDPTWGYSICIHSSPGITSLAPLTKIRNALTGGLVLVGLPHLVTLTGLQNIPEYGLNDDSVSVYLLRLSGLKDATAISDGAKSLDAGHGKLKIESDPALQCVPKNWPHKDLDGRAIPHGTCSGKSVSVAKVSGRHGGR